MLVGICILTATVHTLEAVVQAVLGFGSQVFGGVNCVQFGVSVSWLRAALFAGAYIVGALLFYQLTSSLMAGFL